MKIKICKTRSNAKTPLYASKGAACFDLASCDSGVVLANHSAIFDTGLSFEVPEGFVMMVYSRSGHGFKSDVRLANCVGVIDSDYRGVVKVKLTNDGNEYMQVNEGDRIAQAMIIPVEQVKFIEVAELSDTERGTGGFGSTGV